VAYLLANGIFWILLVCITIAAVLLLIWLLPANVRRRRLVALGVSFSLLVVIIYATSIHAYIRYSIACSTPPRFTIASPIEPKGIRIHHNWTMPDETLAKLAKAFGYVETETLYIPGVPGMKEPPNLGNGQVNWTASRLEATGHPDCEAVVGKDVCLATSIGPSRSPMYELRQSPSHEHLILIVETYALETSVVMKRSDGTFQDAITFEYRGLAMGGNLLAYGFTQIFEPPNACQKHEVLGNYGTAQTVFWQHFLQNNEPTD